RLFFGAADGPNGDELWRTDGTFGGTLLVSDINPGAGSSYPQGLAVIEDTLFFAPDDGTHGYELWVLPAFPIGSVNRPNVNFGGVVVGAMAVDTVVKYNTGGAPLVITSAVSDSGSFTVLPVSGTIPGHDSAGYQISFTPTSPGSKVGHIIFTDNAES